ncbi:MAG: GNAT family N-acetyltransferase [Streptosporangiales bacterium]|nr:GNAT family N-acetyltransferase [Streptosporangiales bacterium]
MEITEPTDDDVDELVDLRVRAFGVLTAAGRERAVTTRRRAIEDGRALVVRDEGRPVASASWIPFRQWWLGRPLDMAGVTAVVVSPEYRGRGMGSTMMRALVQRMHARGFPLSALYPATMPPYRRVGYELAGVLHSVTVRTDALRGLGRDGIDLPRPHRVGRECAEAVRAAVDEAQRRNLECGPVSWPVAALADHLGEDEQFTYLVDGDAGHGFLGYRWEGASLRASHVVADSPDVARALWAQLGSGSSTAETVHANVAPDDPVFWLLRDVGVRPRGQDWWMLRLLDASAAVAARGFPSGVEVDVPLVVTDELLPHNAGRRRLRVRDGSGSLVDDEAAGGDALHVEARGLAALYAGTSLSTLRGAELVRGGDRRSDTALDAAFGGPAFCRDFF